MSGVILKRHQEICNASFFRTNDEREFFFKLFSKNKEIVKWISNILMHVMLHF